VRPLELRTEQLEQFHLCDDFRLAGFTQISEPFIKLIGRASATGE
jgi:hypothetical protein